MKSKNKKGGVIDDDSITIYSDTGICCLCGGKYNRGGHNPEPVDNRNDSRCCQNCNSNIVIPVRREYYFNAKFNAPFLEFFNKCIRPYLEVRK